MLPTSAHRERRVPLARLGVVGALGGMLAGAMMAMVEMVYGWLTDGRSFWDAPMAIWSWVFGLDHFGEPGNHVWPIVLGTGAHMMNSAVVGIVFAFLASALRLSGLIAALALAVVYGLAIWTVMRYVVLPLNEGEAALFTTDIVSPQWVWWLSHAALGVTAGLVYCVATRKAWAARSGVQAELRRAA